MGLENYFTPHKTTHHATIFRLLQCLRGVHGSPPNTRLKSETSKK